MFSPKDICDLTEVFLSVIYVLQPSKHILRGAMCNFLLIDHMCD